MTAKIPGTRCTEDFILHDWANGMCTRCSVRRHTPRPKRITPYKETHQQGSVAIYNVDLIQSTLATEDVDFGIQIASDGRVWICINGQSIIRFRPMKAD